MTDWNRPEELAETPPRRVRRKAWALFLILAGPIPFALAVYLQIETEQKFLSVERLYAPGLRASAVLTECSVQKSKTDESHLFVRYVFDLPAGDLGPTAVKSFAGTQNLHVSYEKYICIRDSVFVVYKKGQPRTSMLQLPSERIPGFFNWKAAANLLLLISISVVCLCLSVAVFLRSRREKRILRVGRLAPAEVFHPVDRHWIVRDRGFIVRYRFNDADGRSKEGASVHTDHSPLYMKTVVFDPKDSGKSLLYPPRYCVLR